LSSPFLTQDTQLFILNSCPQTYQLYYVMLIYIILNSLVADVA
jgi:hypothetical protein